MIDERCPNSHGGSEHCHASEESPEDRAETRLLQEEAEEAPPSRQGVAEVGFSTSPL
jgi:hypothetical protein